jgi:hypothetical protein
VVEHEQYCWEFFLFWYVFKISLYKEAKDGGRGSGREGEKLTYC